MAKNGPLEFCTVLYSNHAEKARKLSEKNIKMSIFCRNLQDKVHFSLPFMILG